MKKKENDTYLAEGCCRKGKFLLGKNNYGEALDCFKKAVELDPSLANAYCGVGDILR